MRFLYIFSFVETSLSCVFLLFYWICKCIITDYVYFRAPFHWQFHISKKHDHLQCSMQTYSLNIGFYPTGTLSTASFYINLVSREPVCDHEGHFYNNPQDADNNNIRGEMSTVMGRILSIGVSIWTTRCNTNDNSKCISLFTVNLADNNNQRVDMTDFDLLRVLGTGGEIF